MKKLIPLLIVLFGCLGGGALGMFLKPSVILTEPDVGNSQKDDNLESSQSSKDNRNYVKVGRQTIIPVVELGETKALMLFELAVDVPSSRAGDVHDMEPKLRDAFLRELFRMSHTGAFADNFTDERVIEELRGSLTRAARQHLGAYVNEVLILDVMRQEL